VVRFDVQEETIVFDYPRGETARDRRHDL
jgi:hypothetical protein